MDAHFPLEVAVGVVADDVQGRTLQARLLAILALDQLRLPAPQLCKAHVHAQQHFGPVLGLGSAGAGVDGEPCVIRVFRGAHFHGQLELVGEGARGDECGARLRLGGFALA
jgi:hypothetical protein